MYIDDINVFRLVLYQLVIYKKLCFNIQLAWEIPFSHREINSDLAAMYSHDAV